MNYVTFGYCMGFETGNKWDCQRVKTNLDADQIAESTIFA